MRIFWKIIAALAVEPLYGRGQQSFENCLRLPGPRLQRGPLHAGCGIEGTGTGCHYWRSKLRFIGEASYAFDRAKSCGEFAISVFDRRHRQAVGSALLCALQSRAMNMGYLELFGETLKANDPMKNLVRKAGFGFTRSLDWRAVRFDKKSSG
jgi:hypothetical protein